MRLRVYIAVALGLMVLAGAASGEFRFPMPEFESGYQYPVMQTPAPSRIPVLVDIAVLTAALTLTTVAVLKLRSRRMVFGISLASLLYFGFYRQGCVCPVGSTQNVLAVMFDPSLGLPLVVAVFFLLPLVFALYFGRVFCAGVCPLGAVQEMCAVYPVQVPRPVEAMLGLLPYAYLGLAVVSVGTGAGYLICRFDPFVGFFRQGASFGMLVTGGVLLLIGVFVGRPYCRFLCPYGVLLRWASRFSKWHATVTPAECTQCRLCEQACPYGAILEPTPAASPVPRKAGMRRLAALLVAAPFVMGIGAVAGVSAHGALALLHPTVRLSQQIEDEDAGRGAEHTVESDAFREGTRPVAELHAEALDLRRGFKYGAAWLGAFIGLVVCGRMARLSVVRTNNDYRTDRAACLSCARCFAYCPVEKTNAKD